MDFLNGEFVDWDAEVDPFPALPLEWEPETGEDFELLSNLLSDQTPASTQAKQPRRPKPVTKTEPGEEAASHASSSHRKGHADETEAERKERLAAACRRFRARRKEEINALKRKNEELEKDREVYLARIADLQSEAQAFREHGSVDLAKENALLRVEIRKHKRFLRTLVSAVQNAPLVTPEEKYRILVSGMSAAHGQAIGLMYTSCVDPSWKMTKPFSIDGVQVSLKYQLLPLGTLHENAKRVNVRADVCGVPQSVEQLTNNLWAWISDGEAKKQVLMETRTKQPGLFAKVKDIVVEEIFPELFVDESLDWESENLRFYRYEESYENLPSQDIVFISSLRDCTLARSAFPADSDDFVHLPHGTQLKGKLLVSSSSIAESSSEIAPKVEGVKRIQGPLLYSTALFPLEDNRCNVSFLHSMPLLDGPGFSGMSKSTGPLVSETGEISPLAFETMNAFFQFIGIKVSTD